MRAAYALLIVVGVLAVVAVPYLVPSYITFQASIMLSYAVAILGLNLIMGFNGQLSLAQGVFFAVGGYGTAILTADYQWPFYLAIPAATGASAVLGLIVGVPALRFRGLELSIVTLGLAAVVPPVLQKFSWLTHGTNGIAVPGTMPPPWLHISVDAWVYYLSAACAGVAVIAMRQIVTGGSGRVLRAVRDNTTVAESFGINVARTKILVFGASAAFGGLGGGLFALSSGYVSPLSFQLAKSIEFLCASAVGGATSIVGAFIGAAFVTLLPEWSASISIALAGTIYAVVLIAITLLAPDGVVGRLSFLTRRLRGQFAAQPRPSGGTRRDDA